MSAFVVSPECFGRILYAVEGSIPESPCGGGDRPTVDMAEHVFGSVFGKPGRLSLSEPEQRQQLLRRLYDLNVEAVGQRYGRDSEMVDVPIPWSFRAVKCNLADAFMAARSLRYQCSEGDVPDTALYDQLDRFVGYLAECLASRSDAVRASKAWG